MKNVIETFQIFTNGSMFGTMSVTSSASSIKYVDTVALQFNWAGNPTGIFDVQGSLDYNPGLPQSGKGANDGVWNSISLSPTPQATGSGSYSCLVEMSPRAFQSVRTIYTNSTGSGVLTGFIFSKGLG